LTHTGCTPISRPSVTASADFILLEVLEAASGSNSEICLRQLGRRSGCGLGVYLQLSTTNCLSEKSQSYGCNASLSPHLPLLRRWLMTWFLTWPHVEMYYRSLCHRAVYPGWSRPRTSASRPCSIPWSKTLECRHRSGSTTARFGIANVLTPPSTRFLMMGTAATHGMRLRLSFSGRKSVKLKLKYLTEDVDRHGNVRSYVRIPGRRKVRIRGVPWSDEFMAQYQEAIAGRGESPRQARAAQRGSFRYLCQRF
jgi:hypothetical protein